MTIPKSRSIVTVVAVALIVLQFTLLIRGKGIAGDRQAAAFAPSSPHFERTWARTDGPVAAGEAVRTWMWGEDANTTVMPEDYEESPGKQRDVQYFDKARMEITHPDGDTSNPWYVTNGLLVVELISGQMQTGDQLREEREPATVNVAGDPNDAEGPTYASLRPVRNAPPAQDGETIVNRIDRSGAVEADPEMAIYGVTAAWRVQEPNIDHQVASPFWAFMNQTGTVEVDGQYVVAPLFESPFYATGLPITEPYWTTVKVAGVPRDVLLQCFERRCLTYTPSNEPAWRVEAGNVGQHYYRWRYDDQDATSTPTTATATATGTTPLPACDPAYPDFCIPPPPPDLDCGDFNRRNFTALPPDPHGLDPDNDGVGCEGSTSTATSTREPSPTSTATPTATRTPTATATSTSTRTATATATSTRSTGGSEAECLNAQEAAFLQLINTYRQQNGLGPLTASKKLNVASYRHSLDMATRDYFDHNTKLPLPPGQSGPSFVDRMRDAGYTGYTTAAENIAAGQSTAQAVFNDWKNSAGHNANMLNASYTQIGIGLASDVDSTYKYYWTTDFANGNDSASNC